MCTVCRGVARKKSRCRHLQFRGAWGHAPSEIFSYIVAVAFWVILRHILKETILYFVGFAELKKYIPFYTPIWKNGSFYGKMCDGHTGGVQSICLLNNFNSFHCIIIKLYENVCWQNISAKFDTQPDPIKHFGVMAIELSKIAKINRVRSVTWIYFNGSSSKPQAYRLFRLTVDICFPTICQFHLCITIQAYFVTYGQDTLVKVM